MPPSTPISVPDAPAPLALPPLHELCSYCNGQWLKPNPVYAEHAAKGGELLKAAIEARRAAGLNGGEEDPELMDAMAPHGDATVTDPLHSKLGPAADAARIATEAWRIHEGSTPTGPDGHPEQEKLYCIECDGHGGHQLTAAGRQILELLSIFE